MLESLIRYREAEKRPWVMFFWAFLICSVGVLFSVQLSYKIYFGSANIDITGIFSVLFTILPSVYFLTFLVKKEEALEEKQIRMHYSKSFWQRHERDLLIFQFYFFGLTLAFAIWAFILPPGTFQLQMMKIQEIRSLTGNMFSGSVSGNEMASFVQVFLNNMQVMVFSFIFSLLFGAGAVFIVVWNASILGVYIGRLSEAIYHIPGVSLNFLPHGVPEIAGYLFAGLAGGIISAAIMRGRKMDILMKVFNDSLKMLGLSVLFILLGALIETGVFAVKIASIFVFYTIFIYIIVTGLAPPRLLDKKGQ